MRFLKLNLEEVLNVFYLFKRCIVFETETQVISGLQSRKGRAIFVEFLKFFFQVIRLKFDDNPHDFALLCEESTLTIF